jgi:hypothetical protein
MQGSLVLIETTGNQRFIFATNRLAENLGASQMIWRVGVEFSLDAVMTITGRAIFAGDAAATRANLLDIRLNPPFAGNDRDVEVIAASSGKALLLVGCRDVGKLIVGQVTRRALAETPGVEVRGYVGEPFDLGQSDPDREVRRVHDALAELRGLVPGADLRFLRVPVVAPCATSGLPASHEDRALPDYAEGPADAALRSEPSFRKRRHAAQAHTRMRQALHSDEFELPKDIEELLTNSDNREADWLGVVHADGNGLGEIFQNFGKKARAERDWQKYASGMRQFSLALDECTERAARQALERTQSRIQAKQVRAFPLVLGGDDLTLVCGGRMAMRFTHDFLMNFSQEAKRSSGVSQVAPGLTASAGVAIVKPHFPFHLAYEIAESLLRSAKKQKPDAALDFHVHYDASGGDLDAIRSRLYVDKRTRLFCRPYAVGGEHWDKLNRVIERLQTRTEDGEPATPSSILHELREALFLGRAAAEERLRWLLKRRGGDDELAGLLSELHGEPALFRRTEDGEAGHQTALLDLLEIREFWE